jgi:hypothetical protein
VTDEPESEHGDPQLALARVLRILGTKVDAPTESSLPLPPAPSLSRYYEATVLDLPGTGAELKAVSVPHTADIVAEGVLSVRDYRPDYLPRPGFLHDFRVSFSFQRDRLIEAILATRPDHSRWYQGEVSDADFRLSTDIDRVIALDHQYIGQVGNVVRARDPRLYRFAARAALEPLIPVESSPVAGVSLAELVRSTGASAALGYFALGADPLLLVTVPAGVILLGGAAGIAEGLKAGLAFRIASWLGAAPNHDDPRPPEA